MFALGEMPPMPLAVGYALPRAVIVTDCGAALAKEGWTARIETARSKAATISFRVSEFKTKTIDIRPDGFCGSFRYINVRIPVQYSSARQ